MVDEEICQCSCETQKLAIEIKIFRKDFFSFSRQGDYENRVKDRLIAFCSSIFHYLGSTLNAGMQFDNLH